MTEFNIIHLIDSTAKVNYGVWNAALINSPALAEMGVSSFAIFPEDNSFSYSGVKTFSFTDKKEISAFLSKNNLTPENSIVISHGSWQWPTTFGYKLQNKGFKWMAVPHGMLEPWSMQQKKLKKKLYYTLVEKPLLKKANLIRAVSQPEFNRLSQTYQGKVVHIPNGVTPSNHAVQKDMYGPLKFLFMGRLHHKKGILPLLEGWLSSPLANHKSFELNIAGPDDGELSKIKPLIKLCNNVAYLGPVYGEDKNKLMQNSHIYVLPSFSEGFPSSVIEAMDYGLLPLISEGCNFPEAFEQDLVIEFEPDKTQIKNTLTAVPQWSISEIIAKGNDSKKFVSQNFTNAIISHKIYSICKKLLQLH